MSDEGEIADGLARALGDEPIVVGGPRERERVAQASGLLSTRVEIAREKQNQALLGSMDRRAKLQLRLQQTVEGLSIAAVTYYVVGLVGYAAKAIKASGVHVEPDIAMGVAIPVVAALVALALRRVRRRLRND